MAKKKQKRNQMEDSSSSRRRSNRLESLPNLLLDDILLKLDVETLCTLTCISTNLRSSASRALALLPSIDLSDFSPDYETLHSILSRCRSVKTLTVNCLCSDDEWHISYLLRPHIEELKLLRCYYFDPSVFQNIGETCPNLRVLRLELDDCEGGFTDCLNQMLSKCKKLESFSLKINGPRYPNFGYVAFFAMTIRNLKLDQVEEEDAIELFRQTDPSAPILEKFLNTLLTLTLVDVISDRLVSSIAKYVPHLLDLNLEDWPTEEPTPP